MANKPELTTDEKIPEWMLWQISSTFNNINKKDENKKEEDFDPFFSMRMSRPGGGINIPGDGIDDLRTAPPVDDCEEKEEEREDILCRLLKKHLIFTLE